MGNIGLVIDTLIDIDEDDSVYVHKQLDTVTCCPDIVYTRVDAAICDTLVPFLWFYRDTMLLFEDIGEQQIEYTHAKWEKCTGEIVTLALDTFHCERLYPLIVNKYNWQLLLDQVSLRRFFPERTAIAYQWFKDSAAIPSATGDDYAEQNELYGSYQLRIQLDAAVDNHDEYIWSNVLDIYTTKAELPVIKRIYNWHGMQVGEEQLTRGVYLILYQQGDKCWTEKKIML